MTSRAYAKLTIACGAALYSFYYATTATAASWHFIDNVDLLIHEAGHVVFSPFGQFIDVLMGSGFQILFPLLFVAYFWLRRAWYSASLLLFWVGINVTNVSLYAGDAQKMQLDLIGGEHDWNWLLSEMHALPYTDQIGYAIYAAGVAVLFAAGVASIATSVSDAD